MTARPRPTWQPVRSPYDSPPSAHMTARPRNPSFHMQRRWSLCLRLPQSRTGCWRHAVGALIWQRLWTCTWRRGTCARCRCGVLCECGEGERRGVKVLESFVVYACEGVSFAEKLALSVLLGHVLDCEKFV
eukprot:204591-Chlamydomonas_euryale.AAC.2